MSRRFSLCSSVSPVVKAFDFLAKPRNSIRIGARAWKGGALRGQSPIFHGRRSARLEAAPFQGILTYAVNFVYRKLALRDPHRLRVQELTDSDQAKLPAVSRGLYSSEGDAGIGGDHLVDKDHA